MKNKKIFIMVFLSYNGVNFMMTPMILRIRKRKIAVIIAILNVLIGLLSVVIVLLFSNPTGSLSIEISYLLLACICLMILILLAILKEFLKVDKTSNT